MPTCWPSAPRTSHELHVGMPDRHVDRLEGQAVQPLRAVERRLDDAVEREIRLGLGLVEVAAADAKLLGVVAPVPRRELEVAALLRDQLLQCVAVGERSLARRRPDLLQQAAHRLRRLRHGVVEAIVRKRRVAEQFRPLGAERHGLGDDRLVVGLAAGVAARDPGAERLLAEIAARRELQERLDAGALQGDDVLAGHAALVGRGLGRGADEIGQAVEVGLRDLHGVGLLVGQNVLAERGTKRSEPRDDLGEPLHLGGVEACALATVFGVMALQHALLLGGKAEAFAPGMERVDTGEQGLVHPHLVPVCGGLRGDVAFDRQQFLVAVGADQLAEDVIDAGEHAAGVLQRHDGVVEGGRFLPVGDGGDLGVMLGESARIGRHEMLGFDARVGRRAKRRGPGFEKGIAFDGHMRGLSTSFRGAAKPRARNP